MITSDLFAVKMEEVGLQASGPYTHQPLHPIHLTSTVLDPVLPSELLQLFVA